MIKVIAFDLIGVLVGEKNIELTSDEDKLERLFGPNISDEEYLEKAKEKIGENKPIYEMAKNIIFKLYRVRQDNVLERIKEKYPDIKIIIATNHVSFVKEYINESFNNKYLDDIIISAEINMIKPNHDFYQYILKKYNIDPNELMFLDDSIKNIEGAKSIGINTIKIDRNMNIYDMVEKYLSENE